MDAENNAILALSILGVIASVGACVFLLMQKKKKTKTLSYRLLIYLSITSM